MTNATPEQRKAALEYALHHASSASVDQIIHRAEKFLQFLVSDQQSESPSEP